MNSRQTLTVLKVSTYLLAVGVLVAGGLVVNTMLNPRTTDTPRTEGERAVMSAERAVQADPDDPEGRSTLAAAYLSVGRFSDALREAEFAQRLDPEDGSGFLVAGMAQRQLGRYANAIASMNEALERSEDKTSDWFYLLYVEMARAFEAQEDYENAMTALNSALVYFPEAADLYYDRAVILEKMGEVENAILDYKAVLTFMPEDERATEAIARLQGGSGGEPDEATEPTDGAQE